MKTVVKFQALTRLIVLLLISMLLLSVPVLADSRTIEPSRDTYVDEEVPSASYGSIGLGIIGHEVAGSSGSYGKIVLLYFDTTTIPAGSVINSATLTVRIGGCLGTGPTFGHTSLGAYINNGSPGWTESSTYQQLSTSGSSLNSVGSQIVACNPGSYVDFDATELVKAWVDRLIPNDGLYLSRINGGGSWTRVIYMREATASSRPKLVINYSIPYESVDSPDGTPPSASSSSTPTNTAKAQSNSQPLDPDESLSAPTQLTATQINQSTDVKLEWKKSNSEGVELYRVFRMEVDGAGLDSKIGEVTSSENTYIDKDTTEGKKYSYFIRAVRNQKESLNTDSVQIDVIPISISNKNSPETLLKSNSQLHQILAFALLFSLLTATGFVILFVKHKKLHRKHKALTKTASETVKKT